MLGLGAVTQDVAVRIGAEDNASRVMEGVRQNSEKAFGGDEHRGGGLGAFASKAKVAVMATSAAVAAAGVAMLKIASDVSKAGDEFQKMSLRTGVSTEELSTLAFAAERSGTSIGSLETGLTRLARSADDASDGTGKSADAFAALGITVLDADGKLRPTHDLFLNIADALDGVESETQLAAIAQDLFGRSGTQLLPILKGGSDGIKDLQDRARALGLEWSTDSANAAAAYQDQLTDLFSAFTGLKNILGNEIMPLMLSAVTWFTDVTLAVMGFVKEVGGFGELFSDVATLINGFARTVWTTIDTFFSDANFRTQILEAIWETVTGYISGMITLMTNFFVNLGELVVAGASLLWEPIVFAWGLIWEPIAEAATAGFNVVGEAVTGWINWLIQQFNTVSGLIGFELEQIDFTPLTREAKPTEERWAEFTGNMAGYLGTVGEKAGNLASDMVTDLSNTAGSIKKAWEDVEIPVDESMQAVLDKWRVAGESVRLETAATTSHIEASYQEASDDAGESFGVIVEAAEDAGEKVSIALDKPRRTFADGWNEYFSRQPLLSDMANLGSSMAKSFSTSLDAVIDGFLRGDFKRGWSMAWNSLKDDAASLVRGIITQQARQQIMGSFADLGRAAFSGFKDAGIAASNTLAGLWDVTGGIGKKMLEKVVVLGSSIWGAMRLAGEAASTAMGALWSVLGPVGRAIITAATTTGSAAAVAMASAAEATSQTANLGAAIGDSLASGAGAAFALALPALLAAGVAAAMVGVFYLIDKTIGDYLKNAVQTIPGFGKIDAPITPKERAEFAARLEALYGGDTEDDVDISAATGFQGWVDKPGSGVLFRAGEAGREYVDIRPVGQGDSGSSGGDHFSIEFNINAIDARGVREFIEQDARDILVELLRREGSRGVGVTFGRGIVQPSEYR